MFYWVFAATLEVIYEPTVRSLCLALAALCFVASSSILIVNNGHSSEILSRSNAR